ncbi:acetyl/propionyl-CoA carboxylase subunit alpha [Nocardia puris]|uniref:biotin carboxylase n=1 Tax=Nocardia puris TaxID=208602 RepID=A0A366DNU5_9NOCA|nr:biotin carboxylase N-terminal domain-containing protein [Nocardia puris]MBF6211527.1 acetyl/propionyl-CoA carboxylase subunit alpha [Nocardia puris]MBF6369586.1 acetyl/propionyl-CoA carboxylase subunit alpha [Nocardia puris]MBF6459027.1 acetyl/propionyl-CoA carboxylase subunit alpha [Nocardia puris]RBO90888.1 acetyl-CoA/propionyl-CoA carboxylase biotin carboxyl carrier protein [Nocardia puris]
MLNKSQPVGFDTVLVANRGEIAVRVIRTLRAMGIRSVAVYSDADVNARHVAEADTAVRLGPAPARESYLDIGKVVAAAVRTGAQAVHPGYGFLSENAAFAAALAEAGIVFLGPPARAIEIMGDKIAAKNTVAAFDVPVVPGIAQPGLTDAQLVAAAAEVGYPVLVKPSAGGGGKGMRRVDDPALLPDALVSARREAGAAFGDDTLFLERFVTRPRHIEVQILADQFGNVVHLGERECSLQRRHQKVIEEAPSPLLDAETRARIGAAACNTARSVDYVGAGTVEFIVSADRPDEFFFMEMNTRLQVEHPVTELVTGVDLVECQVRVAAGQKITVRQEDIRLTGHAVEARVYAEDPGRGFLPTGGTVLDLVEPEGEGVRVDSGLRVGTVVGSDYDPMLSKVIAHAPDRTAALAKLDRALGDTQLLGVTSNIEFLRFLLADPDVQAGNLDTALLDRRVGDFVPAPPTDEQFIAAAAYHWLRRWPTGPADPWDVPSGWRVGGTAPTTIRLAGGDRTEHVHLTGTPDAARARIGDESDTAPNATSGTVRSSTLTARAAGDSAGTAIPGHDSPPDQPPATSHGATPDSTVAHAEGGFSAPRGGTAGGSVPPRATPTTASADHQPTTESLSLTATFAEIPNTLTLTLDGLRRDYLVAEHDDQLWVAGPTGVVALREVAEVNVRGGGEHVGDAEIRSPMPGSVIATPVASGATVAAGDAVVVVEAMKMEHTLTAPVTGTVEILVEAGTQVRLDQPLARVIASAKTPESEGIPA